MSEALNRIKFPELIIGIAGPIGINIDAITECLEAALKNVGYSQVTVKLTTEMESVGAPFAKAATQDYYGITKYKMDRANAICKFFKSRSAMASIGIRAIHNRRREINGKQSGATKHLDAALEKTAFIVRQLKRPDEVEVFRKVYGRQFILVSGYGSVHERRKIIAENLRRTLPMNTRADEVAQKAEYLMIRDASEDEDHYGQHLRDTFHLADVFVDGIQIQEMSEKLDRFIQALFGKADIAPSKQEYGMYAAKSAALRSSDLSRQVGAALVSPDGEIITQGCNEVPKAMGGTYWDLEQPDHRDVKLGVDPNDFSTKELLRDLFERLAKAEMLSPKAIELGTPAQMVETLTLRADPNDRSGSDGALVGSEVLDLTEYGRTVHAEMCAICDAARLGRSVKGATLYCTTFPCHNCTKHIIAVGIRKVVYMEPYPKSRAKRLHEHEIQIETEASGSVSFLPFLGISPFRYRDIFQKGRRKRPDGSAKVWYQDEPRPLIDSVSAQYINVEILAYSLLVGNISEANAPGGSGAAAASETAGTN